MCTWSCPERSRLASTARGGAAHILRICRPGHIVGLAHVLGHLEVLPGSCIATEESEVLVLDIDGFNRALETLRYGPLGENLFRMISGDPDNQDNEMYWADVKVYEGVVDP